MKKKLLIITKYSGDYSPIIKSKYNTYDIVWLQLWPVINTEELLKKYPEVSTCNSTDFINNESHYTIAKRVTHISKNWWQLLGLDKAVGEEWHIEGLKISQIFAYEIEQVLTKILFQIKTINEAKKKYSPDELLFVDIKKEIYFYNQIFNAFVYSSLLPFFQTKFSKDKLKQIYIEVPKESNINLFSAKLKRIVNVKQGVLIKKIKQKIKKPSLTGNNIIISNTNRCLQKFVEIASINNKVFTLDDSLYINKENVSKLTNSFKDVFFDEISLSPFLKEIIPIIENKFINLIEYYKKTKKLIADYNPKMFITVNMANSTELVKLWAFKQMGVRTVLASEGLGQPGEDLDLVLESVLHPKIGVERWVTSSFLYQKFKNMNEPVLVTGYLDSNINEEPKKTRKIKKEIVMALSSQHPFVTRAISDENMFEMLQSVDDVHQIVSKIPNYKLILKLHPGDEINKSLYKKRLGLSPKVKIITNGNLNSIINSCELLIIYDTSAALEALLKKKNVICYNYTNRPSFITSIYKHINQDPKKGAALKIVHTKKELKKEVKYMLRYGRNTSKSPNIDYVLENASHKYDVVKTVESLVKNG